MLISNSRRWARKLFENGVLVIAGDDVVIAPALEVNQEPRYIKYIPGAHFPTDLIYAVRMSRYPDSLWTFDVGTGHLGATLKPGIKMTDSRTFLV
jgi:hypothetical protein